MSDMTLGLRYDLRAPSFGRPHADLYRAALEQCTWAEAHGFGSVALSEHHGCDDGYLPSPLVFAAAVAARTTSMRIMVAALIVPLHDPLRLAEDLAVLDLLSGGRIDLIIGAGYRPEELAMFGRQMDDRVALVEAGVAVLRKAWTGEPFEHDGRTVTITPRPVSEHGPTLLLGASTKAGARRAARIGDGFVPVDMALWPVYAEECARLGREPGPTPPPSGPLFVHVADDPDAAWAAIAPHALHEMNSYGEWLTSAAGIAVYTPMDDADDLRASGTYAVVTPGECVELVRANGGLTVHPLMGGLDPDLAWSSLELLASKVLPVL